MEKRLLPVNAVLGLLTPHDINRPALADAGFTLCGLEVPVGGSEGSVVVDVVCFQPESGTLLLVESKSGANIEVKQALAYKALTPQAVVLAAHVTVPQRVRLTVGVIYACLAEDRDQIRLGLTEAGVAFPILSVSDTEIALSSPSEVPHSLRNAFVEPVALGAPPPRYISFDHESAHSEAVSIVRAELVAALSHERPEVTVGWLTEQCARHFPLYGRAARARLVKVVERAAREVAEQDPNVFTFIPPRPNESATVRLLRSPEVLARRGRTQAYQALARHAAPRRRRAEIPGQLDLLRELDEADDEGSDEADGETAS